MARGPSGQNSKPPKTQTYIWLISHETSGVWLWVRAPTGAPNPAGALRRTAHAAPRSAVDPADPSDRCGRPEQVVQVRQPAPPGPLVRLNSTGPAARSSRPGRNPGAWAHRRRPRLSGDRSRSAEPRAAQVHPDPGARPSQPRALLGRTPKQRRGRGGEGRGGATAGWAVRGPEDTLTADATRRSLTPAPTSRIRSRAIAQTGNWANVRLAKPAKP